MKRAREPDDAAKPNGGLVLTGEGMIWLLATVVLGGVGWYKSIVLIQLLAYLMFSLLLVNGFVARSQLRCLRAVRADEPPVFAGETTTMNVTVENFGTRPVTATVEDLVGQPPARWLVPRLAAGRSVTCDASRVFPTRGRFPAPIRVVSGFPFGLLQHERRFMDSSEVVVLPEAWFADPEGLRRWVYRNTGGGAQARKVLRRVTIEHADVRGVRPFRPGDSLRSVHWRSSARRQELMVREYDAAPAPDLVLVMEPWLPTDPSPKHRVQLEAALSLAVTIASTWGRAFGTRVTIAVAGDPGSIRLAAPGEVGLRVALTPLATLVGGNDFAVLGPETFDRPLARVARVLVSSRTASPYADALSRSTGRHFLAVAPSDPLPWCQPARPRGLPGLAQRNLTWRDRLTMSVS